MKNEKIYDLHTHTLFSDGVLIPAESVRIAKVAGYSGVAITDHVDISNCNFILDSLLRFKEEYNQGSDEEFAVLAGVEITHVRPALIPKLVELCRKNGADIVIVHGETLVEPVEIGTNRAAIESNVDILAHPGLINSEDVKLAAKSGVHLELTTRKGHAYTNGHVLSAAKKHGAKLIVNNDAHTPSDYVGVNFAINVLMGAGCSHDEALSCIANGRELFYKKINSF